MLHNHRYVYFKSDSFVTFTSTPLSGIDPSKLIETLACSPVSDQPKTKAERFATLPRICSRVFSSLIPSKLYPLTRSIVAAASSANFERTKADKASRLFSVFTEISEDRIASVSFLNFVTPSRDALLFRVSTFSPSCSPIAFHPLPETYSAFAFSHSLAVILGGWRQTAWIATVTHPLVPPWASTRFQNIFYFSLLTPRPAPIYRHPVMNNSESIPAKETQQILVAIGLSIATKTCPTVEVSNTEAACRLIQSRFDDVDWDWESGHGDATVFGDDRRIPIADDDDGNEAHFTIRLIQTATA